ncbi:MAG: DNA internalization-related competence protein ComEC/Rec2 [Clostridia bacterium]
MRPFCIAALGTILGIIMGLYFKSIAFFVVIIIIIFIVIFKKYVKQLIIFLICFLLFCAYICILENKYTNICKTYNNKQIKIHGIIVSNTQEKEYKTICKIKVTGLQNIETNTITKSKFNILCNIKNLKENNFKYGDKVIISGAFEEPYTQRNKCGFNYKSYLKTKQIAGTINANKINITGKEISINSLIYELKENLIQKIYSILPLEEATLCIGLLLGEKSKISEDIQQSFRNSSLSHMLAISGAHISYILLGITNFLICIKFNKRWSNIIISIFLIFFIILVGASPSVTRACIMCILNLIANLLFKKPDIYQNLAISSFIILLFNPYALLDIGFQLSFGGTIGIVLFSNKIFNKTTKYKNLFLNKILNTIKQIIIVSLSANIIIFPIIIYHFNTLSLTFLISNILASPILGICLILGMIFIILIFSPIAQIISYFFKPILQMLIFIANICSKLPFSQILVATPKIWQIVIYYLIIILLLYKRKAKLYIKAYLHISKYKFVYKITITILIFLIFFPYIFSIIPNNKLTIHFIDVGQGDSTLIITPSNKTILIDGGGSETGNFNVGEKTLLPYLLDKGILKINYMLFTHFDTDHCQGLFTILENIKVDNVIISKQGENSQNFEEFLKLITLKNTKVIIVKAGDKIKIDKLCELNILFPTSKLISNNTLNNNSIVAKFCYQNFSILLTGDIEQIAEQEIVKKYNNTNILKSTVLKVAHHGSKTSSTQDFVNLVAPKIALIGVGEKNTFGHPSQEILERLDNMRMYNL